MRQVAYDNLGRKVTDTKAVGQPEQQTLSYQYYADNLPKSVTDPLSRTTSFDYDALSNLTTLTKLSGTANAITATATYDQTTSRVLTSTDPLGNSTSFFL